MFSLKILNRVEDRSDRLHFSDRSEKSEDHDRKSTDPIINIRSLKCDRSDIDRSKPSIAILPVLYDQKFDRSIIKSVFAYTRYV